VNHAGQQARGCIVAAYVGGRWMGHMAESAKSSGRREINWDKLRVAERVGFREAEVVGLRVADSGRRGAAEGRGLVVAES
jgi:hypothetical protein